MINRIKAISGAVDVHIHQRLDEPTIALDMDRTQLQSMGISPNDVAQNILLPLSGSQQTQPAFWLNPNNRRRLQHAAQTPQYQISSLDDLMRCRSTRRVATQGPSTQVLGNLVKVSAGQRAGQS